MPAGMAILGALALALTNWIAPEKTVWTFPARLVLLTMAAVAILFVGLGIVCRRLWKRTRKRVRFGILWNHDKQPLCAKCDGPLHAKDQYSFRCAVCEIVLEAREDDGHNIPPAEAIARVQKRTIKKPDRESENRSLRAQVTLLEAENVSLQRELEYYQNPPDEPGFH